MPKGGREALEAAEKQGRDAILALKANQYDMVCNGYEIADRKSTRLNSSH